MGESLIDSIKTEFDLKATDIRSYSPLTLAYIGDSIYALLVKSVVVGRGNTQAAKLHNGTVKYVSAVAQSKVFRYLLSSELVSDEEADILRRGKAAKSHHSAKNASVEDYKEATGLEALFGWLYLKGETFRMLELIKTGMVYLDEGQDTTGEL